MRGLASDHGRAQSAPEDSSTGRISILIVDDELTFGEALELALDHEEDLDVVEVTTGGSEALRAVREREPNVVIMDVSMPGMSGFEATRRILEIKPDTAILILSGRDDDYLLARVVQAGAVGLVRKTEAIANVASTVRRAYQHEALHSEEEIEKAMRRLRHRRDAEDDAKRRLERLTPRETQILGLMAQGKGPEEIATVLAMSPNTLRTHTQNVLTKLGVHSKMEALVLAIRHGKVATVDVTETGETGDTPA